MSPRQIPIAHEVYTPSEERVTAVRKPVKETIKASKEKRGITVVDVQFVSPPTPKAARNIPARAEAIKSFLASYSC